MKVRRAKKTGAVDVEIGEREEKLLAATPPAAFSLKRILVPVDFSLQSQKALHYAVRFAGQFGAQILVLHVVEPFALPAEYGYIPPEMQETPLAAQANAQRTLEGLAGRSLPPSLAREVIVCIGSPWREIAGVARKREVDLIILSTHGYTGLKHVLLGSVAERVVRHAPCPVMVVREREHDFV